jgi:hypothetical protein
MHVEDWTYKGHYNLGWEGRSEMSHSRCTIYIGAFQLTPAVFDFLSPSLMITEPDFGGKPVPRGLNQMCLLVSDVGTALDSDLVSHYSLVL